MCIQALAIKKNYRTLEDSRSPERGGLAQFVPCGHCHECYARRRNDWAFRLYHEMDSSQSAVFMTLTYGEVFLGDRYLFGEHPPSSPNGYDSLSIRDTQLFMKRLRKHVKAKGFDVKLKYYLVGEYGTSRKRPHYHIIMFNLPQYYIERSLLMSEHIWQKGTVDHAPCNLATINYVAGYVMQGRWTPEHCEETGLMDDRQPQFSNMSRGLGLGYLTHARYEYHVDGMVGWVRHPAGFITSMPRYLRYKLFSPEERKELAAEAAAFNSWHLELDWDYSRQVRETNHQIRQQEIKQKQLRKTF